MIKANPNKALETFVNTNTLRMQVKGQVKREQNIVRAAKALIWLIELGRIQLIELSRIWLAELGRIQLAELSIIQLTELGRIQLAELSRIWLVEYGRIRQNAATWRVLAPLQLNYVICMQIATIKERLPVSGIRHVVITCRRGTSVVRNLRFLTLPQS